MSRIRRFDLPKVLKIAIIAVLFLILILAGIYFGWQAFEHSRYEFRLAAHPLLYSEYVEKYSAEYDMDKYMLYAVIKTESGFDPNAVSNIGARGLMQLTEETFDWVKFRLGDGDEVTYEDMFDPEANIRYGAYLFDYLTGYFGCTDTAAAAYFSGIGEVGKWVSDKKYSKDGVHLDNIPSKNAAHYVSKINNAYNTSIELYVNERKN